MIRAALPQDVSRLQLVETAAGETFRAIGMDFVADDAGPTGETLEGYIQRGAAWVLVADDAVLAGYLLWDLIDEAIHVEQVSVHPEYARRRFGQALIDHASVEGRRLGLASITLTTYRFVAWNGPYYESLGFEPIPEEQLGPGLRAIREQERVHGLDRWPRSAMRRRL